jgi:hypothetical protein
MDWDLIIYLFFCGAGVVYFTLKMKELKDDCEGFDIFPLDYIYLKKSG